MKKISALWLLLLLPLLVGFVSIISPETLKKPLPSNPPINITKSISYSLSSDGKDIVSLAAGTYVPEYEDEGGIYYRGFGAPVKGGGVWDGGIWIAKGKNLPQFKIYRFHRNTSEKNNGGSNQTSKEAVTQLPNTLTVQSSIGAGVAGGIIAAIIAHDQGKIGIYPAPSGDVNIENAISKCETTTDDLLAEVKEMSDARISASEEDVASLYWELRCQNESGVEKYLQMGADPNHLYDNRFSPVYVAAGVKNKNLLRLLLEHGGDPNTKEANSGQTAIERALRYGVQENNWDNFEILLGAGANINRVDEKGNTIATVAVVLGRFDKVVELLDHGYNVDLQGLARLVQNTQTAPQDGQKQWQTKIKNLLEKKGIKLLSQKNLKS